MEPIDIEQELIDLAAQEEVLAFFDFTLALSATGGEVEGLCKVSRPHERRSRSSYVSLLFVVDALDEKTRRAVEAHLSAVDWGGPAKSIPGVAGFLPVPHRDTAAGLLLKEVDVYLDGTQPATADYVRTVLQPAVARAAHLRAGEVTAWEENAPRPAPRSAAPAPENESLIGRLRRLFGA